MSDIQFRVGVLIFAVFGWAFCLSLVNLLIGIVAVACSKKLENESEETNK